MMVTRSFFCLAQAVRHMYHLLSAELLSTRAHSLILTRLDYCNSLLPGSPAVSRHCFACRTMVHATRIVVQAPRQCNAHPLLRQFHWLPVCHRINYKVAVMPYKICSTTSLADHNCHIKHHCVLGRAALFYNQP